MGGEFRTRTCVIMIELKRKPGKYSAKKERKVDNILGVMVTSCAAINSAIEVSRSVATKVAR